MPISKTETELEASGTEAVQTRATASHQVSAALARTPLRFFTLLGLFTISPLVESVHLSSLTSLSGADVWWHLRTGLWILQNHVLPHSGIYSQSSQLPWIAASWTYDVFLALAYKVLGLAVIPGLLMFFRATLAVVTFLLAGGLRGRFWMAVVLSAIAQYILAAFMPTPAYGSILLFGIELLVLREARSDRTFLWLVPLFFVWANVSPQFAYGLAALLLFVLAKLIQQRGRIGRTVILVSVASLVSTVFTPYLLGVWGSFFHSVTSAASDHFPDYAAMRFHQPQDYLLLLLAMTAFLTLGLRRSRDLFQILLLVGCASLSFYSQRDIWLVTLAAITVIAGAKKTTHEPNFLAQKLRLAVLGAAALILILVFALLVPHRGDALLAKTSETYPVAAANYIRDHNLPQPLFNSYEWGGFLVWYQPEIPVAIDGRTDLYPDDVYITYSKVMNADLPYTSYPAFVQARTILLPRHSVIAEALSAVPAFHVVYQDEVSTVLAPAAQEP